MKKLSALSFLAILGLFISMSSFKAAGRAEGENRSVGKFTSLGLAYPATVMLKPGNNHSVRLEGDADQLANIETVVKDGQLQIRNKDRNVRWDNQKSSNRVTIHITTPPLEKISVSGSGKIIGDGTFKGESLNLAVSGSGSIQLTAKVHLVSSSISGSGSIELKGEGKQTTSSVSGSGSLKSFDFQANDAKVSISGSGKCEVNAKATLKSSISGSGNVYYQGEPSVDSRISGSGSVRKRS